MSYSLYVARPDIPQDMLYRACDRQYDGQHWGEPSPGMLFAYSTNLGRFLTDFHVHPAQDLDGLDADDCADRIGAALFDARARDMGALADEYNPLNGCGSVAGAMVWLQDIRSYCVEHPRYKVWGD